MALGGPGFGAALFKNEQIAKNTEIAEMRAEVEKGELGAKLKSLDTQRASSRAQMLRQQFMDALDGMKWFGEAVKELGPKFEIGSELDKKLDVQKQILAGTAKNAGIDPAIAEVVAARVRAMSQVRDLKTVGPGSALVDANNLEGPALTVSPPASMRVVEVPGETGTTRVVESTGGQQPTVSVGRPAAVSPGASAANGASPAAAGRAVASNGPPPGEGGKPLPKEAQDSLTGGFAALKSLDSMEAAIEQTGVVRGRVSNVETAFGANKEAIDFQTARSNLMVQAQAIIKGIPSNFDVTTFEKTLPDMTSPQSVNKSRIEYSRNIIKQLIEDTVSYYKYTGARIPVTLLDQARKQGIRVDEVKPWDGKGDSATAKSEALAAGGGKKSGIAGMSLNALIKLNPDALSPEELQAVSDRLKELGH